jgi:hypothetical protein
MMNWAAARMMRGSHFRTTRLYGLRPTEDWLGWWPRVVASATTVTPVSEVASNMVDHHRRSQPAPLRGRAATIGGRPGGRFESTSGPVRAQSTHLECRSTPSWLRLEDEGCWPPRPSRFT